jgi:hypothetical protein
LKHNKPQGINDSDIGSSRLPIKGDSKQMKKMVKKITFIHNLGGEIKDKKEPAIETKETPVNK